MTDPIREALVELLRLYDWRNELGRIERDFNHDKKQMTRWLNQYGREKHAAWDVARTVLAAPPEVGAMTAAIKVLEDAEELLPLAHEANIGVAWAIQTLYDHRKRLETSSPLAAIHPGCSRCGATTAAQCNDKGCFLLEGK